MIKYLYQKTISPIVKTCYEKLIRPIFSLKGSPHSIALGLAIGVWIAFTPTVGLQMTMALIICTIFRANLPIALAMCWISNPITFVPMYYGYYLLGLVILDQEATSWENFRQQITNDYCIVATEPEKAYSAQGEYVITLRKELQDQLENNTFGEGGEQKIMGQQLDLSEIVAKEGYDLPITARLKRKSSSLWLIEDQEKILYLLGKVRDKIVVYSYHGYDLQKVLAKIKKESSPIFYSSQYPGSVKALSSDTSKEDSGNFGNFDNFKEGPKDFSRVILEASKVKGYALVDYVSFYKAANQGAKNNLSIVSNVKREYDLWGSLARLVAISLEEVGWPMWVGSLIIATLITIPCYPVTKKAIISFRNSEKIAKLKESGTRLKQSARQFTKDHIPKRKKNRKEDDGDDGDENESDLEEKMV